MNRRHSNSILQRQHLYKRKNKFEGGINETEEIKNAEPKHLIVHDTSNGFLAGEMVNHNFIRYKGIFFILVISYRNENIDQINA